jgi:hypothetical protein
VSACGEKRYALEGLDAGGSDEWKFVARCTLDGIDYEIP